MFVVVVGGTGLGLLCAYPRKNTQNSAQRFLTIIEYDTRACKRAQSCHVRLDVIKICHVAWQPMLRKHQEAYNSQFLGTGFQLKIVLGSSERVRVKSGL